MRLRDTWLQYINGVVVGTQTNCVVDNEPKAGSARTILLRVKYGDKAVLLMGFIREREPANTALEVVAQALVTDYNPPRGWRGRIIWVCVFDPFNRKWTLAKCIEDMNTHVLEVEIFGEYNVGAEGDIMKYALQQNITTYQ